MKKYIIANWKSNKSLEEAQAWASDLAASNSIAAAENLRVVLCPPAIYLSTLSGKVPGLVLGAQSVSSYPNGAYTGAISAQQLSQWATFALLGHAERRKYFGETAPQIAQQVRQALDAKMTPIIAVDDQNWMPLLSQFEKAELARCLVMYEPPSSISTSAGGHAADLDQVLTAISHITAEFSTLGVLYGGSISPENVAQYLSQPTIAGVVPGAASLDSQTFIALLTTANTAARERGS